MRNGRPNLVPLQICGSILENHTMRRVVHELLGYKTMHMTYRGTDDDSDSIEQIGGHPPTPLSHTTDTKRSAYTLNDEQLESALDLLSINSLPELSRQDFSSFGKKQSWIQLAQRCTRRLATDLLRLSNVGETAERCMLLHHRLESRKSQRIRTSNDAQNAIQTLYACCMIVRDVWKLSAGGGVADVERTVGKIQVSHVLLAGCLVPLPSHAGVRRRTC